jgi:signal transduction histidine kinase
MDDEAARQTWAKRAGRLARGISESLSEIHHLARGLVPVEVDSGGLLSALSELASSTSQLTITAAQDSGETAPNSIPIKCTFKTSESIEVADNMVATHLYRIAQEAVNNAVKHGKCDCIEIAIERIANRLCLQVVDNGKGIEDKQIRGEFTATEGHRGLGLRTMAYRAGLIGATLAIDRGPERGTRVRCTLPM